MASSVAESFSHMFYPPDSLIIEERPSYMILKRAVCAVLCRGPPAELEDTIERSRVLLTYSYVDHAEWTPHPLMADMKINLSDMESRAR